MKSTTCLILAVLALAATLPEHAIARDLERATLYRLDAGSTFQRGCFDPVYCEAPEAIALLGTFVMQKRRTDVQTDGYQITELHWRGVQDESFLLLGSGVHDVRHPFAVWQVTTLDLGGGVEFVGQIDGIAPFPRLDVTLTATFGPYDEARIVLKASPVDPVEVAWYRLKGDSSYVPSVCSTGPAGSLPLTGTFGIVDLPQVSGGRAIVNVRWSAEPASPADPSRLFVTGFGIVRGTSLSFLLYEDGRAGFQASGELELPAGGAPLIETVVTGYGGCGQERTIRLRARSLSE